MKIVVIGAGAMGSIYGGRLSQHNEVYLIDTNQKIVDRINDRGLTLVEGEREMLCYPRARVSAEGIGPADLVILFVKALYSRNALAAAGELLGENTYVMTLQNGAGHEAILNEYVKHDHIIIGTTEDNGCVLEPGKVRHGHGGAGHTNVGLLVPDENGILETIKSSSDCCGFKVQIHQNIQKLIWHKLFTNVSLSALTGVLQVDMGFIAKNPHAWSAARRLIHEAVAVANRMNLDFDEEEIAEEVKKTSQGNPAGCTSIRADLRDGRKTEVDTISGAVVRTAHELRMEVPSHELMVNLIHSMEERNKG